MERVNVAFLGSSLEQSYLAATSAVIQGKSVLITDPESIYGGKRFIQQKLEVSGRSFVIDRFARPIWAAEPIIEHILKLNIEEYFSFKSVPHLLFCYDEDLRTMKVLTVTATLSILTFFQVPLKKEDVFQESILNLVEKRKLMKAIETIRNASIVNGNKSSDFYPLLESLNLPVYLRDMIIYAILLVNDACLPCMFIMNFSCIYIFSLVTIMEAQSRLERFFDSIFKFQVESPLLFPSYGLSEFPQAFCRKAAVFGAHCMLETKLKSSEKLPDGCTLLHFDNSTSWISEKVVMSDDSSLKAYSSPDNSFVDFDLQVCQHSIVVILNDCTNLLPIYRDGCLLIVPPRLLQRNHPVYLFVLPEGIFPSGSSRIAYLYSNSPMSDGLPSTLINMLGMADFTVQSI